MRKIVVAGCPEARAGSDEFYPLAGEAVRILGRARALLGQPSSNGFIAEPFFSHRFAHERADTGRIGSAAYSDQIHFSPELGLNDG